MFSDILSLLLTDSAIQSIGTGLGAVVLSAFTFFKVKKTVADRIVDIGIPIAFQVVNEIARRSTSKVDDKVALGLAALRDYCATHNVTLSKEHEARAEIVFKALHADSQIVVPTIKFTESK